MKSFVIRVLSPVAVALMLSACQSVSTAPSGFESELAAGNLEAAQLKLGSEQENPAQLTERRKRLADAYLQRSREALQKGDMNGASAALARARSLTPKAPAVAADVGALQKQQAEPEKPPCEPMD
ncbi:hypothetical protein D3C76_730160 [compost metagenome]